MTSRTKTLVISLDCANPDLLREWARDGVLPALSALMQRGTWGLIHSPFGSVDADWPSLYTGTSPDQHGGVSYDEIVPGTYQSRLQSTIRMDRPPFWETLSAVGRRVAVINAPKTQPLRTTNGIHLSDWATHDTGHYSACRSWPPELAHALAARYPDDAIHINDWGNSTSADPVRLIPSLERNLQRKVDVYRELLDRGPWDLFFAAFDECHETSHLFWHVHDASHPQHDAELRRRIGDPIQKTFIAVDAALANVLARASPEATVIVIALAGIGPNYKWSPLLDHLLRRLEEQADDRSRLYDALRPLWGKVPHRLQHAILRHKNYVRERLLTGHRRRRTCFALPLNERCGGIRINLVGREPHGIVQPGEPYDRLCEQLEHELLQIVDVDTRQPLVRSITQTREHFRGTHRERMPDILVEWDMSRPIYAVESPRLARFTRQFLDVRTGCHGADGIFFAAGSGIKTGPLDRPVGVMDFAPTLIALHGLGESQEFNGRRIPELCGRIHDTEMATQA